MAKKALDELLVTRDDIQLEEVEVLSSPLRSLRDGIKFIPTLRCGDTRLSGILLSREAIESFLDKVQTS